MSTTDQYELVDGREAEIEQRDAFAGGTVRIAIDVDDGPCWTLDVTDSGEYDLITSRDEHGQLEDVPVPDWVEYDILPRIGDL